MKNKHVQTCVTWEQIIVIGFALFIVFGLVKGLNNYKENVQLNECVKVVHKIIDIGNLEVPSKDYLLLSKIPDCRQLID